MLWIFALLSHATELRLIADGSDWAIADGRCRVVGDLPTPTGPAAAARVEATVRRGLGCRVRVHDVLQVGCRVLPVIHESDATPPFDGQVSLQRRYQVQLTPRRDGDLWRWAPSCLLEPWRVIVRGVEHLDPHSGPVDGIIHIDAIVIPTHANPKDYRARATWVETAE